MIIHALKNYVNHVLLSQTGSRMTLLQEIRLHQATSSGSIYQMELDCLLVLEE